jgi:hypothetical protein
VIPPNCKSGHYFSTALDLRKASDPDGNPASQSSFDHPVSHPAAVESTVALKRDGFIIRIQDERRIAGTAGRIDRVARMRIDCDGRGAGGSILVLDRERKPGVLIDGSIDRKVRRFYPASREEIRKYAIQRGDLLFSWRNGSADHVGKTAYISNEFAGFLHVSFLLKIRPTPSAADSTFLWVLLNVLRKKGYFKENSREQINRKFNATELGGLRIPPPPLTLQTEYAELVQRIETLARHLDAAAAKAEAMATALSSEVFDQAPRKGNGHAGAQAGE